MNRTSNSVENISFTDEQDEGSWPDPNSPTTRDASTHGFADAKKRRPGTLKVVIPSTNHDQAPETEPEKTFQLEKDGSTSAVHCPSEKT